MSTKTVCITLCGWSMALLALDPLPAQGAELVKDVWPGPSSGICSCGAGLTPSIGSVSYFAGNDGVTGYELWKTDGTAGGTMMVKDILAGQGTGLMPGPMTEYEGRVYFRVGGSQLWVSDGTGEGTQLMRGGFVSLFAVTSVGGSGLPCSPPRDGADGRQGARRRAHRRRRGGGPAPGD